MKRVISGFLCAAGLVLLLQASWIHAKALLAQILLEDSWSRSVAGKTVAKPWPWADTSPIARLEIPAHDTDLIVLEGASGRTLAFAPGWLHGTAHPGGKGTTVIAGHRDTHFAVLEKLRTGDILELEGRDSRRHQYRIAGTEVVDQSETEALRCAEDSCLVLVTCWPFDAIDAGGPLRFIVYAPLLDPEVTTPPSTLHF